MMLIDFPNQTSFSCIGYQILLLTLVIHSAMQFLFRVPLKPSVVQKEGSFVILPAFIACMQHRHLFLPGTDIYDAHQLL